MKCPKCHSSAYHIHDFLSGGGSTENRQSGEKSDNKDSAWRCIICGHYEAVAVESAKERVLPPRAPKTTPLPRYAANTILITFMDSIKNELVNGTNRKSLAKLLSAASKTKIAETTLSRFINHHKLV